MDVRSRVFGIAVICTLSISCSQLPDAKFLETNGGDNKPNACPQRQMSNQFIVNWNDGKTSVVRAKDKQEFFEQVLIPKYNEINFAEYDIRVFTDDIRSEGTSGFEDPGSAQDRISAPQVWAQGVTGSGVIVGVVDSGPDLDHIQLTKNRFINLVEVNGQPGVDDDNNGLVDDVSGWDFYANKNKINPQEHGTHVSGIIGADPTSGVMSGVAPNVKILATNFMDETGNSGSIGGAIAAMKYSASMGAKVVNASWGTSDGCSSASLKMAVDQLGSQGILFVAAAGNSGLDFDLGPANYSYPAAVNSFNSITVAASGFSDIMTSFSNKSFSLVHLTAPGASVFSTISYNRYASFSGTSMAAPFVSGAAALLFSARPQATVSQIKQALFAGVDKSQTAIPKVLTRGRLNVAKSLDELKKLVP